MTDVPATSDSQSAVERAGTWLRQYLAERGGQARAQDVLRAAVASGHTERTCRRACAAAGVTVTRRGFRAGSVWTLDAQRPDHSGRHSGHAEASAANTPAEPEPVAAPTTRRVPTRVNVYGRADEYAQVSTPEAASHWDARAWRSRDEL
jgi:hypothetical protein